MERIMIIGCGGAGKSTLARQLGDKLGLPVVHLDQLWWKPGWEHISREEFDAVHRAEIEKARWILDGNFNHTILERLQHCDTVLYLDFSRMACLMGIAKRIATTYGKVRPDMGEGCPERIDLDFLKWVWHFNKKNRKRYHSLLRSAEGVEVIVLKNRKAVKAFLDGLRAVPYKKS